jgi:hypothetical protein
MLGLTQATQASDPFVDLCNGNEAGLCLHPQVGVLSRIIVTYTDLIFALQDIYLVKGLRELFQASTGSFNGRPNRSNSRRVSDTLIGTILA